MIKTNEETIARSFSDILAEITCPYHWYLVSSHIKQ